nr:copia protein [Tanacetum cinerariifolium]
MSMTGEMTFFLGLQVNQSPSGIFINQSKYVHEILKKYGLNTCDIVGTPMDIKDKLDLYQLGILVDATKYRSMIGALMYLTSSRSDIVHATCVCARYQAHPTKKHLKEVKRIFLYLRGTINMGLWYTKDSGFELTGFSYADYAGCKDSFKSTFGGAQFLNEKLVSWSSKKQDYTLLSTVESEYVSLSACCAQVHWMRTQLTDYGYHFDKIPIYCDSKSAIAISCNPVQHSRMKHIAAQYHFIKEHVEKGTIELYIVKTDYQLADIFTKALPLDRFNYLEKVLVITALNEQLDKLKGKAVITEAVSLNPIDPKLLKVDVTPVVSKLRKNRTAHTDYIRHTQEEAATLRKIVKCCPNRPLKFLGTVKFGNDHVAKIMGYGDYQIGNVTISRVYYVEGIGHNLFSVGQFCDSDLEVAFRQHTCFIRNLDGVDLLTGPRGNNLYSLSLQDMMASSPICLLYKASKTKSWIWHRRLSHLNFGAINHLAR